MQARWIIHINRMSIHKFGIRDFMYVQIGYNIGSIRDTIYVCAVAADIGSI